jgi:hypothetical protein
MIDLFNLLDNSLRNRKVQEVSEEDFIDGVMQSADLASEGRGFLMISVGITPINGKMAYVPTIISLCANDDVATVIESEILQLAAMSHEHTTFDKLKSIIRKRKA